MFGKCDLFGVGVCIRYPMFLWEYITWCPLHKSSYLYIYFISSFNLPCCHTPFLPLPTPGIAASKTRVVLTDRALHCVFILTQHGQILSKVSQHGTSPGDLLLPYGIAINKDGYIFVSESGNHRISVFTPGGKFERCFGSKGSEGGKFDTPRHVCFNHLGQLVVCDEQNQRVQLFDVDSK